MEIIVEQAGKQGQQAVYALPERLLQIGAALESNFNYNSLMEVEQKFALTSSTAVSNSELISLSQTVRDQVVGAVNLLYSVQRYIYTRVPMIEDGGNFGVSVQMEVLKAIKELIDNINTKVDDLPEYFSKRIGIWEKITPKTDSTVKKTETKSNENKDGAMEDKETSTTTNESTKTIPFVNPDALHALVAVDIKFYLQLHRLLQQAHDALLITADVIDKNKSKLINPKSSGGTQHMF
eukprot:CFRG6275T1